MKQPSLTVAVTVLLGLELINAAALPAAQINEVQNIQRRHVHRQPCSLVNDYMTLWDQYTCAFEVEPQVTTAQSETPTLTKRDDPIAAPPAAAVEFIDELEAVFVKYENLTGLNKETTIVHAQADGKPLHTRDILDILGIGSVGDSNSPVILHRFADIVEALIKLNGLL